MHLIYSEINKDGSDITLPNMQKKCVLFIEINNWKFWI